jgi:hypothetical protein
VQQLKVHWCPGDPSIQCLATFRLPKSPLHRHCYSRQQDVLRARPVRTRIVNSSRAALVGSRAGQFAKKFANLSNRPIRYKKCTRKIQIQKQNWFQFFFGTKNQIKFIFVKQFSTILPISTKVHLLLYN